MREGLNMAKEYYSLAELIMDDESFYEQFRFEKRYWDVHILCDIFDVITQVTRYSKPDLTDFIDARISKIVSYTVEKYGNLFTDDEIGYIKRWFLPGKDNFILMITDDVVSDYFIKIIRHVILYDMFLGRVCPPYESSDLTNSDTKDTLISLFVTFEFGISTDRLYYLIDWDDHKIYHLGDGIEAPYYFNSIIKSICDLDKRKDSSLSIISNDKKHIYWIQKLITIDGYQIEFPQRHSTDTGLQTLRTRFAFIFSIMDKPGLMMKLSDIANWLKDDSYILTSKYGNFCEVKHIFRTDNNHDDFVNQEEFDGLDPIIKESIIAMTTIHSDTHIHLSKKFLYLSTNNADVISEDITDRFTAVFYLTDGLLEFPYNKEEK